MTATKPTIAIAKKLAKEKFGSTAFIRHNPKALTESQKVPLREKRKANSEEIKALRIELLTLATADKNLREAARFAVDVDFQEPSASQLRDALSKAERRAEISERISDLGDENRSTDGLVLGYKYDAGKSLGWSNLVNCQADTIEELVEKLEAWTRG